MDKLMQKAMEKHKIVRYQQSFIDVMTTYKSLLEAETEQLRKHDVSGSLPPHEVRFRATRFAHECRLNAVSTNSQTVDLYDKLYGQ